MIDISKLKRGKIIEVECGCYCKTKDRTYITKRGYQFILCAGCRCAVGIQEEIGDKKYIRAFTGPNTDKIMEDLE